jgi:hypothetical protein
LHHAGKRRSLTSGARGAPIKAAVNKDNPMTGSYARDIKPKFRPGDVTCMARAHIKLADATWMCDPASAMPITPTRAESTPR